MARFLFLALVIAACGGTPTTQPPITQPPVTPSYDLAKVKATWTTECADPAVVDAEFCDQVQITSMTQDGAILNVPTTLKATDKARAETICSLIAHSHFDSAGTPLGYEIVGILDTTGGNLAACTIP